MSQQSAKGKQAWMAHWMLKSPDSSTPDSEQANTSEGNNLSFSILSKPPSEKGKEVAAFTPRFNPFNTSLLFRRDWFQKKQGLDLEKIELSNNKKSRFDLETMRICTTVDLEAYPSFFQTTQSVLITKKAKYDVFRAKELVNRGLKLQSLSSLSSGEERNFEARKTVTIRNESSAETDTLEMDFSKEKMNYGVNSTSSTKAATSSRETKTELPDINIAAVESPPLCPSSSRTQSLEMEMLLANAVHTKTRNHITTSDDFDPSTQWVKRLKLGSLESLSHDGTRNSFKSFLDGKVTSFEPSPSKKHHRGQETVLSDKNEELLVSNAWIKRWLRKGSEISEAKNPGSKLSGDIDGDEVKKEFPSIGAMAMMGKAMSGFQACEVRKRGSVTVWNSKGTF